MRSQLRPPEGLIASRIEALFASVREPDGGPHPAEVAAAINTAAGEHVISPTYLWQLRTGRRDNPTYKHLVALARYFDVSPAFFFDEAESGRGAIPPEAALAMRYDEIRQIAIEAAGLSPRSRQAIRDLIASARAIGPES
jgi:transcriptional regulator with XRE-family HTH domain